jgi:hypothetical protein
MKKLLVTMLMASLASVAAFGQGSVAFQLDSNHAIYFTANTAKMIPADAAAQSQGLLIAGQGAYTGDYQSAPGTIAALPSGVTFTASLFGGATAGSMTLQTTTTIGDVNNEGGVVPVVANNASVAPGVQWFWDIKITSTTAAGWSYLGDSGTFNAVWGAVPVQITDPAPFASGGAASTWAAGTAELTDYPLASGGPFGAIALQAVSVPEPGTFALAGLGLASLLIFRRRS